MSCGPDKIILHYWSTAWSKKAPLQMVTRWHNIMAKEMIRQSNLCPPTCLQLLNRSQPYHGQKSTRYEVKSTSIGNILASANPYTKLELKLPSTWFSVRFIFWVWVLGGNYTSAEKGSHCHLIGIAFCMRISIAAQTQNIQLDPNLCPGNGQKRIKIYITNIKWASKKILSNLCSCRYCGVM